MKSICAAMTALFLWVGCRRATQDSEPPSPVSGRPEAHTTSARAAFPWFETREATNGFNFHHHSGANGRFYLPEMETGGVGLIDYDGDGLLDIVCVDGGSLSPESPRPPSHRLYHNLGGWKFADVTTSSGIVCHDGYGMGCAVGDYDGDGRPDVYITQWGSNHLFRNNGDGTFTDVTLRAGVAVNSWSTSAAFLDYDGDGRLDLVVANYLHWTPEREMECASLGGRRDYCSPLNYDSPAPTTLFHNRGDGTFEDVTEKAGLLRAYGNGFGVATGDFDHDGRVDFYIANDATPNQLWLNQGGGRFVDEALPRGCALNSVGIPRAGMGVVAVDLMQQGCLDLFVTHLEGEGNGLFLNQKGLFSDAITPDGPMANSAAYTGFGVVFGDFDNDGVQDLYVANGRVRLGAKVWSASDPYAEPNTLRRGLGSGKFEEVQPQGGTDPVLYATSRGLAVGDLDNNGKLDLVIIHRDGPAVLLRNITSDINQWITFDLRDTGGRAVHNAVIRIEAGGRTQWRQSQPNEGYCSSHEPRVHFGLGKASSVEKIFVRWPNGQSEEFGPLPARTVHLLTAGHGRPAPGSFSW